MRFQGLVILSLLGLSAASPVPDSLSAPPSTEGPESFKPNWETIETDYKDALAKVQSDPALTKRINTGSASNVGFAQAIYAAGAAAVSQVKDISNWNQAREEWTKLTTLIMLQHNPDPSVAVSAICYNKGYSLKDPKGIYGLRSEELAIWPLKTDWDCFYMGKNNAFWSEGDGGTINLYTRWYSNSGCRFDSYSDLYC